MADGFSCVDGGQEVTRDALDVLLPVDLREDAPLPVVVYHRQRILLVDLIAPGLDLWRLVAALKERRAAHVALPGLRGRHVRDVIHAATLLADPAALHALEHHLARRLEVQPDLVSLARAVGPSERGVQRPGLRHRTREAVENVAVLRVRLR